jgi:hypothetical protein
MNGNPPSTDVRETNSLPFLLLKNSRAVQKSGPRVTDNPRAKIYLRARS